MPLLAPQLRVVAIDLPGFGSSPPLPGGGFDLGVVCERVEAAIAELGLERPAMLGHSLGGGVTVRYAAERPGALRAVALVAPAGLIATGAVRPSWRHPRLHALGRVALRAAIPLIASRRRAARAGLRARRRRSASLDAALARELLMGAAQGRSTPAAGIEIVYAGLRDRLPRSRCRRSSSGAGATTSSRRATPSRCATRCPTAGCWCCPRPGTCPCASSPARSRRPCWSSYIA